MNKLSWIVAFRMWATFELPLEAGDAQVGTGILKYWHIHLIRAE